MSGASEHVPDPAGFECANRGVELGVEAEPVFVLERPTAGHERVLDAHQIDDHDLCRARVEAELRDLAARFGARGRGIRKGRVVRDFDRHPIAADPCLRRLGDKRRT